MNRMNYYAWGSIVACTTGLLVGTNFCPEILGPLFNRPRDNELRLNELLREAGVVKGGSNSHDLDDEDTHHGKPHH